MSDQARDIRLGLRMFASDVLTFGLACYCAAIALSWFGIPDYDSTDKGRNRSGLIIRHDAMTGCDYLETRRGGLTPRLNRAGNQVCR